MPNRAAFVRSLMALQAERRTGALVVSTAAGQTRMAIALRDGEVVFATETAPHRKLGRRLVEQRVLTPEAHALVIERMPRVRAIEEPVRFCDVAVEAGHLKADAVTRILAEESRQSLVRACAPDDPEWAFEEVTAETRPLLDYVARSRVRIEPAVVAALREVSAVHLGELVARLLDAPVALATPMADITARFSLLPKEAAFVGELATGRSAPRDLLQRRPADEGKSALAVLAALAITRQARESTPPPSSRRMPVAAVSRPPLKSALAPPTPISARPPTSGDPERMAREALAAAHEHVRIGRWSLAAPDIARALSYQPESPKALLYSRWTKMQMEMGQGNTKQDRTEVARLAMAATKADPEFGFAFYVAGNLAFSDDDVVTAHKLLSKAVKLDPALADATRLLRVVDRRINSDAPSSSRGIFGKKLF
jgi:hypothetical protein